jgi:adenylate cyclase
VCQLCAEFILATPATPTVENSNFRLTFLGYEVRALSFPKAKGSYRRGYNDGRVRLTCGSKLGAHEIQSPLGAGGMGEVYRATDTKLGRDVALKVLPAEMAQDAERLGRFRREAKTLAQLDHPNIVTIYAVEESDGVHFLTMQLVDGQPLDRLIPQDGLPIERIVEIGSAMAEALAAAHEKNIVHRDLKPANVMVSNEGRVKVLDFGLAKDIRAANLSDATMTSDSRTQVGVVMGTPAYMSPEQAVGRPLDHRTDIFSLGVVLYEMSTGRRPFEGASSAELISAILRDTPPSVTDLRRDLPADLARIIRRCLEKDPRYRMQTARDVSNEFRDLVRSTAPRAPVSTSAAHSRVATHSGVVREEEGFWVAVLPFKYGGTNADLMALAEGLSEEVITGLSRFSYLRVIARGSTSKYSSESSDIRAIGKELGARYMMEASLRQAGSKVRLAVQLVDATTGSHLWAETYERAFTAESVFELQDDLVPRIVATVADQYGVLPRTMSEVLRSKPEDSLTPHEAVLRTFSYFTRLTQEEHAMMRRLLERVVREAPGHADSWAMLSMIYRGEYAQGFNPGPNPLDRALAAAERAVDLAPTHALGHYALATVHFFRKEKMPFRVVAERALALNPMDGSVLAYLGLLIARSGERDRGCEMVNSAMRLNPHYPGWFHIAGFDKAYGEGKYAEGLEALVHMNTPGYFHLHAARAAALGQLGQRKEAQKSLQDLLALRPNFAAEAREEYAKWYDPGEVEHVIDGLRKAGLEIPYEASSSSTGRILSASVSMPTPASGARSAAREDEGFWIAVLPFKYTGGSAELKALAEGLSEEVITGLSRFSYLRVIARGSTAKYSSESGDVRAIGKELGARYVMEGSLRHAGTKLRLAVQLVDAISGAHLWAENYERTFTPESVFEVQDDLVPRIVSTVADGCGVLPRTMSDALRSKNEDALSPHEALLRAFSFFGHITPEEHATVRRILERAVQEAPDQADCWAMLAQMYNVEFADEFNAQPNPLDRSLAAAQRAISLAPTHALGHYALAFVYFFRKEIAPFHAAAERALALNPMDGYVLGQLGLLMDHSGEVERGGRMVETAMQLNPNHPPVLRFTRFVAAYRDIKYAEALEAAVRINMPGFFHYHAALAATLAQLGQHEAANKALHDVLALRPDFATQVRRDYSKWWNPDLVEHMVEGLRKAGLEIPDEKGLASASPSASGPKPAAASSTTSTTGSTRTDEGFWVAVLPFKYTGNNTALIALAEGLTEDITTGLSRFSYLKVIARSSTERYASGAVDVRSAVKELSARFVIEGSLRHAGTKLRFAVQLVDAVSGAHLWAENFERTFNPETVFALQDELVPRIVSTVADAHGILPHTMGESIRSKNPEQLSPYEAVLRAFSYAERVSPEEHAIAQAALERAVEVAPNYAYGWAMLSLTIKDEIESGFNPKPDAMERILQTARRAVELDPSGHRSYHALALAHFYRGEIPAFRTAADRAIALNPMDGCNVAHLGGCIAYAGEWERGCGLVERALQLNPNHPGWFWFPLSLSAYRKRDYSGALGYALRINLPNFFWTHMIFAAIYGQLGQQEEAGKALQELLKLNPHAVQTLRPGSRLFEPELVEHIVEGLRKAGLEIPDAGSGGTADQAGPERGASGK